MILYVALAVTLEGTIIHKSGLMTGGRSTHNSGKKWEEKDVQGKRAFTPFAQIVVHQLSRSQSPQRFTHGATWRIAKIKIKGQSGRKLDL